jgi:beta-glucanase (GH16 family)
MPGDPSPPPPSSSAAGATSAPSEVPASPSPSAAPSAGPAATLPPSADLRLVWSDEFDEPAGTPPNPERWRHNLGDGTAESIPGWGNNELEFYTDDPANASTDGNGNLVIRARAAKGLDCYYGPCRYTSARLLTEGLVTVQYGRVEARLQVPVGAGLWPAFWALGTNIGQVGWPNSGEIDIMEYVGRQPNRLYGTIHGPGYSGSTNFGKTIDLDEPVADAFHVFAIDWQPGLIVWTLDGAEYHRATPADVAPNAWAFDQEFFLLLNLAVGGNLGGPVDPATVFPAEYRIDYVRVYAAPD